MKIKRPRSAEEAAAELISKARQATEACEQEKNRFAARIAEIEIRNFPGIIRELARLWQSTDVVARRETRSLDDPVSGRIYLDETLSTVFAHSLVQRLGRVKQLSFSYAQFPSARHSRLSHSLGVAKNAEVALSGILDRGHYYIGDEEHPREFDEGILRRRKELVQKAKLVALLHDVGHGPFGHALDNYAGVVVDRKPDKKFTTDYIRGFLTPTLRHLQYDPEEIIAILGPEREGLRSFDHLIADIVDSPMDVDRMDYLVRDAHMTGLEMGFTNTMALIDYMRPVFDQESYLLAYDQEAIGYMEHLLSAREAEIVRISVESSGSGFHTLGGSSNLGNSFL